MLYNNLHLVYTNINLMLTVESLGLDAGGGGGGGDCLERRDSDECCS